MKKKTREIMKSAKRSESMLQCEMYFKKEEHGHDLKRGVYLADGLDLIPFIGHKVGPPDADWSGVAF